MFHQRRGWMPAPVLLVLLGLTWGLCGSAWAQSDGGPVYCFAPGTPQETIDAWNRRQGKINPGFYAGGRWSGTLGSPRALTWSLVPDGVPWGSEGLPSQLFQTMDAKFAAQGGRQKWISLIEASLARWEALSGVSYTRVRQGSNDWDDGAAFGSSRSSTRGDIRIGMIPLDGPYNLLAYNYYPSNGDMVLDANENWAASADNFRFMRNVIMHEHGHGLGLYHVCPVNGTKLMEPYLNSSFDGPQHDDIRAIHYLYGDPFEDNNTIATAAYLGMFSPGTALSFGDLMMPTVSNGSRLSVDGNGEEDYFRFGLTASAGLSLTIAPVGLSYDSSPQNSDGSCSSGTIINSLALADLGVVVTDANANVLAMASAQPAGQAETVASVFLPAAGDYYIRVFETNTPTGPQLYRMTLDFEPLDCNGNGVPDTVDVSVGTSRDCNGNGQPDECEPGWDEDGDGLSDFCEWSHGDFDLDGDVDQSDFGILQRCLGLLPAPGSDCARAELDGDGDIDAADLEIFEGCMSGPGRPYDEQCR
ncbi:MAG TPA: matrixin family metalloprotease [Phycisphaerae bacterium]|nr:matrixin family metalloprotease [Phycisphaerae bacterium]HOB76165.1 matrixin family metalloprotease [Phycisphaerae bacterium]HOJ54596.1 matrixin family metalloprotease [Phycisphaerae bacterium]HOL27011.1 matrixin family metalloprotease [Phycisphaerae bacterium]HPP22791.1 matrixin family metalloprotease [Phycisphaerae bacterium]